MRKMIFLAGIMFGFSMMAYSQSEPEPETVPTEASVGHSTEATLKEQLELNAEQEAKLKQIIKDTRQARQALNETPNISKEDLRVGLEQIRTRRDERIGSVLNGNQMAKWNGFKAKIKEARKAHIAAPALKPKIATPLKKH